MKSLFGLIKMYLCQILYLGLNLAAVATAVETNKIYLNSYKDCGHDKTNEVSLDKEYLVMPDISPETGTKSFLDCEATFHSPDADGHICMILEGAEATILDNNVQLQVFDGLGSTDDETIVFLKPYPQTWAIRDVCSKTRFITFYLHKIQSANPANIRKVQFKFRMVDIKSRKRSLYLDGSCCNRKYDLLDSQMSLTYRSEFSDNTGKLSECTMMFNKVMASSNSSICVVYIPLSNVSCHRQWRFIVSSAYADINEKYFVYSLRCNDAKANKMHAWCGKAEHSLVTVIFQQHVSIMSNSSLERPGEFRFLVTDYEGSADSLLKKVKESMIVTSASSYLGILEIVLICACVLLVIILIVIVCVNRQRLPCNRYKAVNKRDSSDGTEAHL